MDRDEPRFARATVEMMERGEWLIPYFNGEYRFDKPPLTYWWMRLHYALLGVNELSARLHSVLAAWLTAWLVFLMGRDLAGARAGWWAAFGWLTCLQVLVHGRLCVADMPMVLCVTLAMRSSFKLLAEGGRAVQPFGGWWWMLWLSLGAGFLAKGPIALLVPLLALLLWRVLLWRKPIPWCRLQAGWGIPLLLLIVAGWGIPALWQTQGLFWKVGIGEHVVKRGADAFNGRVVLPFYYFISALASLFPWLALAPLVWQRLRERWNAAIALYAAWFAAPYVIFFFYATQLPHYVMPGFPAFFVLFGLAMGSPKNLLAEKPELKLGVFGWTYLLLFSLALVALASFAPLPPNSLMRGCLAAATGMIVGLAALVCFLLRSRWVFAVLALGLLSGSLFALGSQLRSLHPIIRLQPVLASVPPEQDLVAWRYTEPGLVFYAGHPWKMVSKPIRLEQRLQHPRTGAVLLLHREWTLSSLIGQLREGKPVAPSTDESAAVAAITGEVTDWEVHDASGLNLARSSWVEVRVLKRKPEPPSALLTPR